MSIVSCIKLVLLMNSFVWCTVHMQCNRSHEDMVSVFENQYELIPKLVSVTPKKILQVTYCNTEVCLGNHIPPCNSTTEPLVSWPVENDYYYTLAFIDPDSRNYLHWLVVNIPGRNITDGHVLASYLRADPRPGPEHNYCLFLYMQVNIIKDKGLRKEKSKILNSERVEFDLEEFADKHRLGIPIAGNTFRASSC